jgi:subtilase family serine protease
MLPGAGSSSNLAATASSAGRPQGNVRALCPDTAPGYARCFALVRTDVRYETPPAYTANLGVAQGDLASAAASAYYGPLGPAQIQQAYNLPSATAGKGQTVGIVDAYDDPTAESDLAQYRSQLQLPACTTANRCFTKLNENGAASPLPKPNGGWAGEISLDLDMVSAVCPNCHIVLVEASSQSFKDFGTAVKAASRAGARQISNSYGGPECYQNKAGKTMCAAPTFGAAYNIPNTVITASAGDSSWFAGPQSPADYGTVVSVGGTSIYPYANQRGWLETAWTDGGSSCSKFVQNPSWIPQSIGCPGGTRPIADVSAVADPYTGVLVYETYPETKGGFRVYGGTSVSSPIIAAVYALAGNAASQHYGAKLYTSKSALTDVVIGKNGILGFENNALQPCQPVLICTALPGYDGPTGNGTPYGVGAF